MFRTCALAVVSLILAGCAAFEPAVSGSGKLVTEKRKADAFTKLEVAVPTKLVVKKGDETSVELTIDDNLQSLVKTEVVEGTLVVKSDKNLAPHKETTLTIVIPSLQAVSIVGSAEGSVEELAGAEADLSISGSGKLAVGLAAEKFSGSITGSGDVALTGSCRNLSLQTSGAGDWDSQSVAAEEVSILISGSGSAKVNASKSLSVTIAGSGDVKYLGDPKIQETIAGSGSVKPIQTDAPEAAPQNTPADTPKAQK